jgi:flavin reductase (DIM6/NTAB) family NADH-FMN oxidoreductase RutF
MDDTFERLATGTPVRVLFTNPCCALITQNEDGTFNGMTVSWLTPTDNHAGFVMSLHHSRHTRANLARDGHFSLSVAVEGMESTLLALGGESGKDEAAGGGGKLARLGPALVATAPEDAAQKPKRRARVDDARLAARALPALAASPARLLCRVRCELTGAGAAGAGAGAAPTALGQSLLLCEILDVYVRRDHWVQNKLFVTPRGAPRLLCFQGSGVFAAIETRGLPPPQATASSLQASLGGELAFVDEGDPSTRSSPPVCSRDR